jgi:hypothetical protein
VNDNRLSQLSRRFILERLDLLKRTDLASASIDDLKAMLVDLLSAYTSTTVLIDEDRPIFRARRHREHEMDQLLDRVDEIYPKACFIKRLGRANRERTPIFYFSADKVIALHELKPNIGEIFSVIECRTRQKVSPFLVPIGIHELARRHNARIGGDFPEPAVRIRALLGNDEDFEKHKLIDNFVAAEFMKVVDEGQEHLYKLTIAIAELLFDFETDIGPIDGIAYPSIASEQLNANVALLPKAFHRLYKPVGCTWTRIEGTRPNQGFLVSSREAKGISNEGEIAW